MFTAYKRYFDFQGRSSRSEFWLFVLFYVIVAVVLSVVASLMMDPAAGMGAMGPANIVYYLFVLASIIPSLSVSIRRLHDTDRTGWLVLLGLIPLVGLILIYFYVLPGTKGPNKFGPDPLGTTDVETFA